MAALFDAIADAGDAEVVLAGDTFDLDLVSGADAEPGRGAASAEMVPVKWSVDRPVVFTMRAFPSDEDVLVAARRIGVDVGRLTASCAERGEVAPGEPRLLRDSPPVRMHPRSADREPGTPADWARPHAETRDGCPC